MKGRPVLISSKSINKDRFPDMKAEFDNSAMKLFTVNSAEVEKIMTGSIGNSNMAGITLNDTIQLIHVTQPPILDGSLQRIEAGVRRNWAVRSGLMVREAFTFGYGSKLVIELPDSEKVGLTEEDIQKKINELTEKHKDIIKEAYRRDTKVKLIPALKTMTWQAWISGRGLIVKLYNNSTNSQIGKSQLTDREVKRLLAINSRRLGIVVLDDENDMEFEGVIVDGQGLKKTSMIYAPYYDRQISPYSEYYGYTPLETVQHIVEELNIAVEEDYKEILKSAWIASILFQFNTAGLSASQATAKINRLISAIKAGKYIGVNEDIIKVEQLKLDANYEGLIKLVDSLETKIYKVLQVPQFLVQSESIANRATALQSAQLFINGVITNDQEWLADTLQEQWYDDFLKEQLRDTSTEQKRLLLTSAGDLPFHIRRVFNQPKVADFLDLAEAIQRLLGVGVWDVQKANEELGTEEVTPRVEAEAKAMENQQNFKNTFNQNPDMIQKGGFVPPKSKAPVPPQPEAKAEAPKTATADLTLDIEDKKSKIKLRNKLSDMLDKNNAINL